MKEELLKGLSEEQIEKARGCKTSQELLELAKEEGVELTEEQLAAVSGGCGEPKEVVCPYCSSHNVDSERENISSYITYTCRDCGQKW